MNDALQLKPGPWKHLALFMTSVAFVVVAVLLGPKHPLLAWLTGILFGLGAIVALVTVLPGSSFLRLEPERMTVCSLYRTWHIPWSDIDSFFVASVGGRQMVCWRYAPGFFGQQRGRAISRTVAGVEAALPDTYGKSAIELATLLNQWRAGVRSAAG